MSPPRTSLSLLARRLLLMVLVVLPLATLTAGCGSSTTAPPTSPTPTTPTGPADLQIIDITVGDGDTLSSGNQQGTFIYDLWHYDPAGTDGSKGVEVTSGTIAIRPGSTTIIAGVSQGIVGMQTHGKRRLIIPPSLAWGTTGNGSTIAPNEWVVFEFELLDARDCTVVTCQS